jgi:hypothetical protein
MTKDRSKDQPPPPLVPAINNPYDKRRGKKKYRKHPHCMYFYYVNMNLTPQQGDKVQHYYVTNDNEVIEPDDVKGLIIDLIKNARGKRNDPPQCGAGTKHFVWTRKSYIVFAVDDPNFTFDNGEAFHFYEDGYPNHTFFDAWDGKLKVDGRNVAICYCINHMKRNDEADELGGDNEFLWFKLKGVPLALIDNRLPDSGGTNQGPAVPPPE